MFIVKFVNIFRKESRCVCESYYYKFGGFSLCDCLEWIRVS